MSLADKKELIETLKTQGIYDKRVLNAINLVPREIFIKDIEDTQAAYQNIPLPIDCGQTISQPYIVASMTQALFAAPKMNKILEIGTGSGYQTAILATLANEVYTIERIETLYKQANKIFKKLDINNVHTKYGDGIEGWIEAAPFDGIIVTACASEIPDTLLDQLANNGRMISPVGTEYYQELVQIDKKNDEFFTTILEAVRFVPLKPGKQ